MNDINAFNKQAYLAASIVVGILILVSAIYFGNRARSYPAPAEQQEIIEMPQATGSLPSVSSKRSLVISYTNQGFSPETITVKMGEEVTFVNESTKKMWIASDPHPLHTGLPTFDQLKSVGQGESYTYTFDKVGTWKYHNHVTPSVGGTVIVL